MPFMDGGGGRGLGVSRVWCGSGRGTAGSTRGYTEKQIVLIIYILIYRFGRDLKPRNYPGYLTRLSLCDILPVKEIVLSALPGYSLAALSRALWLAERAILFYRLGCTPQGKKAGGCFRLGVPPKKIKTPVELRELAFKKWSFPRLYCLCFCTSVSGCVFILPGAQTMKYKLYCSSLMAVFWLLCMVCFPGCSVV